MLVPMVRIGHMGVRMDHRFVRVTMAVRTRREIAVDMVVVPVAVGVRMLVHEPLMSMGMPVRLHQVKRDAQEHQDAADRHGL